MEVEREGNREGRHWQGEVGENTRRQGNPLNKIQPQNSHVRTGGRQTLEGQCR